MGAIVEMCLKLTCAWKSGKQITLSKMFLNFTKETCIFLGLFSCFVIFEAMNYSRSSSGSFAAGCFLGHRNSFYCMSFLCCTRV